MYKDSTRVKKKIQLSRCCLCMYIYLYIRGGTIHVFVLNRHGPLGSVPYNEYMQFTPDGDVFCHLLNPGLCVFHSKQALLYNCVGCGAFHLQRMGKKMSKGKQEVFLPP